MPRRPPHSPYPLADLPGQGGRENHALLILLAVLVAGASPPRSAAPTQPGASPAPSRPAADDVRRTPADRGSLSDAHADVRACRAAPGDAVGGVLPALVEPPVPPVDDRPVAVTRRARGRRGSRHRPTAHACDAAGGAADAGADRGSDRLSPHRRVAAPARGSAGDGSELELVPDDAERRLPPVGAPPVAASRWTPPSPSRRRRLSRCGPQARG